MFIHFAGLMKNCKNVVMIRFAFHKYYLDHNAEDEFVGDEAGGR